MVEIPETKLMIEQKIENRIYSEPQRSYFGVSMIGGKCSRASWYSFRWASKKEITARIHRLFNRGHREEPIIIADLVEAGCTVHSAQKEASAVNGHVKSHIDGIVENVPDAPKTPHLLEIKTMADKYFTTLKTSKSVEQTKPEYFAQCQGYMKLYKLKRTLFIAVNKNNDDRYYERIPYKASYANELFARAEDIITAEIPPKKIGGPSWWECKWCDHYHICQFDEPVQKNCRTCQHCDIYDEGRWGCSHHNCWLSTEAQRAGCTVWTLWEALK